MAAEVASGVGTAPPPASSSSARSSFQSTRVSVGSYEAHIGVDQWRDHWPTTIKQLGKDASKYVLLTDSNIDRLYGQTLLANLKALGLDVIYLVLPPGEQTKCRETKAMIEDWMFSHNCGRDSVILAFGGGVMGDLCGYVASGYMRGIPFIQLPTSFLAMVDSSIGGKTGIDTPAGKNLIGAFHRPLAVLIDLSLLLTLPQRELCNGMAESIKAGLIASAELFELMEHNVDALLKDKDLALLAEVVQRSVAIKAHVVLNDERESGLRSILNMGHSIGHAIEALCLPHLLHGECISIGTMEEIILARGYGLVGSGELRRVDNILRAYSLPTRVPHHLSPRALVDKMSIDKKNKNGKKELVLLTGIGSVKSKPKYTTMVPDQDLLLLLSPSIGVSPVSGTLNGTLSVPGSKSLSNRILLLAAMGRGPCTITGLLHSQDTQVMLDSLTQLGIKYAWQDGLKKLRIEGCEGKLALPRRSLFLNNAGTASRFLTTLVCLIPSGEIVLTGNARMQERPIKDLVESLRACGCNIEYAGPNQGCLPLRITGNGSGLRGGVVTLAANISSQYVSSILLSAPYASGEDLVLRLDTRPGKAVVSKPFIDMTVDLMRRFNIDVVEEQPFVYRVKRGAYLNPEQFEVEGDASSATYPLALAAVTGGTVTVANVGSESLQGDAKFYTVLQAMGCHVSQTATTTTVRGPDASAGEFLRAIEVDMDALTDTFMTLAAVAVFAQGTTRITNIANQRVKECNRLAVMVSELAKIGVQASESESGIDVVGVGWSDASLSALRTHITRSHSHGLAVISCNDDHRIAMSMAVVATRVGQVVLDEKRCVDKTYPEFWEDAHSVFGVPLWAPEDAVMEEYARAATSKLASAGPGAATAAAPPSVVLVGMRGSGKTQMGTALAKHLKRHFIDLDALLESQLGCTLKDYVEKEGWAAFRAKELAVLADALQFHATGCVISCGGGVVETPAAVTLLQKHGLVVQLRRDIEDVVQYLTTDKSRPDFDARSVWEKREPLYVSASRYEFFIAKGDSNWPRIESDFFHLMDSILSGPRPRPARNTFFLSLTLTDPVSIAQPGALDEMTRGADAIEVRVDLLTRVYEENMVKSMVSAIRSASRLPLIYTVRSMKQGGAFIDYHGQDAASNELQLVRQVELGMRLGCEMVDIEAAISASSCARLYKLRADRYPHVQIISSHHETGNSGGTSVDEVKRLFERCLQCAAPHRPDVVKVVVMAALESDSFRMLQAAAEVEREFAALSSLGPPIIALAMGPTGRATRIYNQVLTPVTHPSMARAAAPGQLSIAQIMRAREVLGLSPFGPVGSAGGRRVLLFGTPIQSSPSPLLHNSAFDWLHLAPSWSYHLCETDSAEAVARAMEQEDFAGANVTIPLKEDVVKLLPHCSDAVKQIGAVNTIVRRDDGSLYGENTDWQGIRCVVEQRMSRASPVASDVGVVMGAGGTARAAIYALQQMGFAHSNIVVFNPRTTAKAHQLAQEFKVNAVDQLTRANIAAATKLQEFTLSVLVSTVPGSAGVRLADAQIFEGQADKPVVLDASYIPSETALLAQCVRELGVPSSRVARGLDMLVSQGIFGCQLWVGKTLPQPCRQIMEANVRQAYNKQHGDAAAASHTK